MSSSVTALRRHPGRHPGAVPLDPAEARDRSVRRRVNAAWGLLYLNTMTFVGGVSLLHIPSKFGKGIAQGALPLAILVLLTVNPKVKLRPNVFLCLVGLLVVDTVITSVQVHHLGTAYRTFRLAEFVVRTLAADAVVGPARHAAFPVPSSLALRGARLGAPRPPDSPGSCPRF